MIHLRICFLLLAYFQVISCQDTSHLPPCTMEIQFRHFPSGFDCESYFTCATGLWVLQRCTAPFLFFDRVPEACNLPELVHDCEFATTTPPGTTVSTQRPNPVDCPNSGVVPVPNPYSCTRFFMCFHGVAVEQSCSPGLFFSRSLLKCVRRPQSDCLLDNESCPAENDPNNIVFLPDQEDCQMYFVCYDGVPVEFNCGETLHWDPLNNWCIKEEDSVCEPSYPLPEVREIECPEDTADDIIFLPHPEECQFYFICINGESILARCGRNLLFDYIIENCFFAESARCFNRIPNLLRLSHK